jgi:glycerate kinase
MAGALGVKFKKRNDHQHKGSNWLKRAELVGEQLENIQTIDASEMIKLSDVEVQVLCDVDNPLTGATGATHTYARQKGADDAAIKKLENGVLHFGSLLEAHYGKAIISVPGAGAAGGLGAGAMAFLNARLQSGINYVLDNTNFESALKSADLVITGEGKIDQQTLYGKLIKGITERANKLEIPVIALCGSLLLGPEQIKLSGLKSAHSINPEGIDLETALLSTASHLEQTTTRVINAAIS